MPVRPPARALGSAALAALLALHAGAAGADPIDSIGSKLLAAEAEVRQMAKNLKRPEGVLGQLSNNVAARRLIDAEVDFGVGDYEAAAIVLYDLVEKYPKFQAFDEALYYLAESLFMRGDYISARTYFVRVVKTIGKRSRFYVPCLERLVEVTLKLQDTSGIEEWMRMLEAVPSKAQRSSIPYVIGKYYFFNGDYERAIGQFALVRPGTRYAFQARYFAGSAAIANKDLVGAMKTFDALVRVPPKSEQDRRVVELAHLALGRLNYERDQPASAIKRYLMISRKSDLFDDALYEVAWVYVRNKEFDKALRALELLAVSDPTSAKLPDVRILEGNLRIRKARIANEAGQSVGQDDYDKADGAFADIKQTFEKPRGELEQLIAAKADPRAYLAQITGRQSHTFDVGTTMPDVAAAWLREEPEVHRVVEVEHEIGQIESDIEWTQRTIERLDRAVDTPAKVNIFPGLADKRTRSIEIHDDLFGLRVALAKHGHALLKDRVGPAERAELDRLEANRIAIARQLGKLPNSAKRESARISLARGAYAAIDRQAAVVFAEIQGVEAQLVALEKYLDDSSDAIAAKDRTELGKEIDLARAEVAAIKQDLAAARDEVIVGQDLAGTGDEVASRRADLRGELDVALDAEQRYTDELARRTTRGDGSKSAQVASLASKAAAVETELDRLNQSIETIVEDALGEVRAALDEEKQKLVSYRQELGAHESESREIGGVVLASAFQSVSRRFYQILIRADVGLVDVGWAMKEATDKVTRRLQLDQARERRTLDTEFADTLKEARDAAERTAPAPTSTTVEPTAPAGKPAEPPAGGAR